MVAPAWHGGAAHRTFAWPGWVWGRPPGCPTVRSAMDAGDVWGRRWRIKRKRTIRIVVGPRETIQVAAQDVPDVVWFGFCGGRRANS